MQRLPDHIVPRFFPLFSPTVSLSSNIELLLPREILDKSLSKIATTAVLICEIRHFVCNNSIVDRALIVTVDSRLYVRMMKSSWAKFETSIRGPIFTRVRALTMNDHPAFLHKNQPNLCNPVKCYKYICESCIFRQPKGLSFVAVTFVWIYAWLATKWLRVLSISSNEKIRNHLVANPIASDGFHIELERTIFGVICMTQWKTHDCVN